MKKALAIILCVVAVCFASCNKEPEEKPNQKFIGSYQGKVTGNITVKGQVPGMEPMEMPFDSLEMDLIMSITAGNKDDKVVASCTIIEENLNFQEETQILNGTVNGDAVDFDPLTINRDIDSSHANITIDLSGNKVNGITLNIAGNITGDGTAVIDLIPIPIPITFNGTINGTLNKLLAE